MLRTLSPLEDMAVGLYEDPVVYDVLHARGTAEEVDGLVRMAVRFVRQRTARRKAGRAVAPRAAHGQVWLEPACGTGRYLRLAARRGVRVIGFDRSPVMVEHARNRVGVGQRRGGRVFVAEMTAFGSHVRPASVDFAFNLINTVRHLGSDAEVVAHLNEMARALKPDGVYAVGLSLTGYGLEQEDEDVWEGRRGALSVRQVAQYFPPIGRARWERVVSHVMVRRGREETHHTSAYRLRCYSMRQWRRLVAMSALREVCWVDERGADFMPVAPGYGIQILRRAER